jgi:transposase
MRKEIGEDVFQRRLILLKKRLRDLLAWKNPNSVLKEVIKKVARQKKYILTFVEHEGVPNHNNFGEYIIKKGVLKRKVSGGSMSEEGVRAYAVLQSIAQTCHLRKISFLGFLTKKK